MKNTVKDWFINKRKGSTLFVTLCSIVLISVICVNIFTLQNISSMNNQKSLQYLVIETMSWNLFRKNMKKEITSYVVIEDTGDALYYINFKENNTERCITITNSINSFKMEITLDVNKQIIRKKLNYE